MYSEKNIDVFLLNLRTIGTEDAFKKMEAIWKGVGLGELVSVWTSILDYIDENEDLPLDGDEKIVHLINDAHITQYNFTQTYKKILEKTNIIHKTHLNLLLALADDWFHDDIKVLLEDKEAMPLFPWK